ncbi:hypothetical protein SESBI_38426 [Sesbania bispinosa]|nr:hypothetical protein SESBI_38426 [Sesbania bispinosa]
MGLFKLVIIPKPPRPLGSSLNCHFRATSAVTGVVDANAKDSGEVAQGRRIFETSSYLCYRNLFFLSHSLLTGVANLRSSRGEVVGANRARSIADSLDRVTDFGSWRLIWS